MENRFTDTIIQIICYIVITATLLSAFLFVIDDIHANAQEPNTITLKAGTYMFNDVLTTPTLSGDRIEQNINFEFDLTYDGVLYKATCSSIKLVNDGGILDIVDYYFTSLTPNLDIFGAGWISVWLGDWVSIISGQNLITITEDTEVDYAFGTWYIANTNYNEVNGNGITIPYINVDIPTDIQIMENINIDINGFGSTSAKRNVGITLLNGDTLGRIRKTDGTTISFNGIAVTSFERRRPIGAYSYPLTDDVIATAPFVITNGLMLYVWDDTQYYQIAWYNPADELWYVHSDYAIIVPYGQRSTSGIGTLTDGIAISLSITPNLTVDDLGYVELGSFEGTFPSDNIITVADEDAYSTFAMFCNANFISDSEKLAWGIAQHQSGLNLGQSQQLGENILGQFLQAPIDILDSIVIYTTPNGTAVTLMGVFGALLTLSLVIIFLKLFAGG